MSKKVIGMVLRKISKTGGSLTIRLPPFWVKGRNLRAGDTVSVEILRDGSLLIKRNNDD
jgi:antitoxin component of MazEF toxin-antitoxin module